MKLLLSSLLLASAVTANDHDQLYQLHGSGTTNPSKCYWSIMETLHEQAGVPTRLSYRAVGSTTGIAEFRQGYTEALPTVFGSGDIPIPQDTYDAINGDVVHLPVLAGAVSFFHSVPGDPALNLTACIIGQLYTGAITTWGDDQITKINPNLSRAAKQTAVTVARRLKGSSSTESATKYLSVACDDDDLRIPEELVSSLPTWPNNANMEICEGSGGMTDCINNKVGTIGYIDAGHGVSQGLSEVRLHNKDSGVYRTTQDASIKAAITVDALPSSPDASFADVTFLNQGGEDTWPIVQMTYIYVRKNLAAYIEDPQEQALLIAFLRSLYNEVYVDACAEDYGFTTLSAPSDVRTFAEGAIDMLEATVNTNATKWFFETSTTAVEGAMPFVFSVKRKQIADLKIASLQSDVSELSAMMSGTGVAKDIEALATELEALKSKIGGSSQSNAAAINGFSSNFSDQDESQLQAALVLGSLSFLMWMLWGAYFIFKCVSGGGAAQGNESIA